MATTITTEGEIRVGPGHQVIDIYVRRSHKQTTHGSIHQGSHSLTFIFI